MIVEHLDFAHTNVSGVAPTRVTDGEPIIPSLAHANFEPNHEISIFLDRVTRPAFMRPALDRAINDLIIVGRSCPTGEVVAVVDRFKTLLTRFYFDNCRTVGGDRNLSNNHVMPETADDQRQEQPSIG